MPTMHFLHGVALREAIIETLSGERRDLAVAFIGRDALARVKLSHARGMRIICDLWSGCCNPDAIRELHRAGAHIKNLPGLHAKIYLGDDRAIVASANWSSNGFGDSGAKQYWGLEAGCRIDYGPDLAPIEKWFEAQFKVALKFDPDDSQLDEAWRRRPLRAPPANIQSGSILRRALTNPNLFDGIGFVFSNSNNKLDEVRKAVDDAKDESPDLADYIDRWRRNAFTEWQSHRRDPWPQSFFAYHRGDRGSFALDALQKQIRNPEKGYVLASRDWSAITQRCVSGTTREAARNADRKLAQRFLDRADDGLIFMTARDMADWYEERWGLEELAARVKD